MINTYLVAIKSKNPLYTNEWCITPKWYFRLHGRIPDTKSQMDLEGFDEIMDHVFLAKDGSNGLELLKKHGIEIMDNAVWCHERENYSSEEDEKYIANDIKKYEIDESEQIINDIDITELAYHLDDMCVALEQVIESKGTGIDYHRLHTDVKKKEAVVETIINRARLHTCYEDRNCDSLVDKLTASEAVYGFAGWLTTRKEPVTFSHVDNAAIAADLVNEFVKENKLAEPRDGWHHNLIHPSGECSHGNVGNIGYEPSGEYFQWETIAKGLYKILDDIDTASDHYKPEKSKYSHYVMKKVREKGNYMCSDGYQVFPKDKLPVQEESDDPMIDYFVDCAKIEKSYSDKKECITKHIQQTVFPDGKINWEDVSLEKSKIDLHSTFDASVWASEFSKAYKQIYKRDIDEEWMHGWFANAIMCGWDHQSWKRDKEYIYIIKTRGGDILKVFHWEPSEKDIREEYIKHYPEDLVGKDYDIWDYIRLFRWSRSYGLTEVNGYKSDTQYEWKAVNQ